MSSPVDTQKDSVLQLPSSRDEPQEEPRHLLDRRNPKGSARRQEDKRTEESQELLKPIHTRQYTDPYATHQHILEFYALQAQGTILEFGTGLYSTPVLRKILKNTDKTLITFESDPEWLTQVQQRYPATSQHQYIFVQDWKTFLELYKPPPQVGLVFVDQSPWEARIWTINTLKDVADYVVVHDVDYFPKNGLFGRVIDEFTFDFTDLSLNFKVYYPEPPYPYFTGPPTLVFSNQGKQLELA